MTEIKSMTYEQARDELVTIVSQLEQGGLSLDQSLALWERGEQLSHHCTELLAGAQQRIDAALQTSSAPPQE